MISREKFVEQSAFMAAMLEVAAPKPGNVSPYRKRGRTGFEHFIASSSAIAPVMGDIASGEFSLGQGIFHAVNRSMSIQSGGNVHLGIILLFAPIASAAGASESLDLASLRYEIGRTIDSGTYEDTIYIYNAIKHASPSGLPKEVFSERSLRKIIDEKKTVREWMSEGKKDNLIAREYCTDFEISFETVLPSIIESYRKKRDIFHAIIHAYLILLSRYEDSHIIAQFGKKAALDVKKRAMELLKNMEEKIGEFDRYLRDRDMNPGTSADMVASALYLGILSGEIEV